MKSYYVYVLLCADRSFYTGITNEPEVRVAQHQEGNDPRCYTFTRRPVKLVHCSEFHKVADAIALEKQLKGWSRAKKSHSSAETLRWYTSLQKERTGRFRQRSSGSG
jgi:putative endonuclease